jgi:hypothetical protein
MEAESVRIKDENRRLVLLARGDRREPSAIVNIEVERMKQFLEKHGPISYRELFGE